MRSSSSTSDAIGSISVTLHSSLKSSNQFQLSAFSFLLPRYRPWNRPGFHGSCGGDVELVGWTILPVPANKNIICIWFVQELLNKMDDGFGKG